MFEWLKSSRKLVKSIGGTIGVKGLSLLINLFTTAAYMHYFAEQSILGVWLALVSILNWIMNFDLGVGNGLRNKLVEALHSGDKTLVNQCISSAYIILGAVSAIILIIGNCLLGIINWNVVLNISYKVLAPPVLVMVVRITFSGVVLQFFFRLIISILYAIQKPATANLLALTSHSMILIFVSLFKMKSVENGMIMLSIMQAITANLPLIFATIWVFRKCLPYARPRLKLYQHGLARGILNLGYQFFWIQLSLLILNSTNDFLITRIFGPDYVVEYQVYDKIFILVSSGFSLVTVPVWSAVTKARVEKRIEWIKKVYQMLLLCAMGITVVAMVLPIIFQTIVNVWLGSAAISVRIVNAYIFAVYNIILTFNYASTSIANGLGELKTQMRCNTLAAIAKVPLVFLLAGVLDNWICVMVANIIIILPCVILQPIANIGSLSKLGKEVVT